jgi:hypothetical protein
MEKTVCRLGMLNCDFARTTLVTCLNRQCHEIDIFTSFITLTVITVITGEFGSSASWSLVRLSVDNDTGRSHESPDVTVQIVKILKIMKVRYTRTKLEISC